MRNDRILIVLLVFFTVAPFLPALSEREVLTVRDHRDYFVPLRNHTATMLKEGSLPLWNPWNGSGERWLANPQTGVFYPPSWLFLILPFETAYVVFLAGHVALLGVGFFFFLRRWVAPGPAFFGGIAAALSGPALSLLDVSNNLASLAWAPWLLSTIFRTEGRFSVRPAILLTLSFLAGEPVLTFLAAVTWAGGRLLRTRGGDGINVVKTALLTVALSAAQLIPFIELLLGSDRLAGLDPGTAFGNSMSLRDWLSVAVAPWGFGSGLLPLSQNFIPVTYVGTPVVLLALAALVAALFSRNDPLNRPTAGAVLGLLFAIAAASAPLLPAFRQVLVMLHVNASRYPARFAVIGALALAALAAFALERLPRIGAPARYAAAAAMLAIPAFFAAGGIAATPPRGMILMAFGLLATWIGVLCLAPALLTRRGVIVVAALILAVDLYVASRPLLVHGPFVRKSAPWSALVSDDRKLIRLGDAANAPFDPSNAGIWMGGYRNLLERKFDASTPAPVVPLEYLRLHDHALYDARIDLLHRLSVGYLITDRTLDRPELSLAGAAGGIRIYSLPGALPLATAWNEGVPAPGASVSIAAMEANRAVIDVSSPIPVSVVLTQLDARGWRASVDGKKQFSAEEKKLFRAIDVPAGRHRIVWEYDPFFVRIASVISILSLIAVAARELIGYGSSAPKKL